MLCSCSPLKAFSRSVTLNWQSPEARNAAIELYNSIRQSDYIVGLVVVDEVSGHLLPLSSLTRLLQTVGLDLDQAMHEIDTLLGTLNSMRSAETFKKLYDEALIIAEQLGVTLCKQRINCSSISLSNGWRWKRRYGIVLPHQLLVCNTGWYHYIHSTSRW